MKKKFNQIFTSLSLFILLAMPSLYADQGDSFYIQEANNNSSLEVDFKLKLKVDIFQFQGEDLPKYKKDINENPISL
ncbi:MAG: hypothetical protein R3Y46_03645 [Opitutales bacterium]